MSSRESGRLRETKLMQNACMYHTGGLWISQWRKFPTNFFCEMASEFLSQMVCDYQESGKSLSIIISFENNNERLLINLCGGKIRCKNGMLCD